MDIISLKDGLKYDGNGLVNLFKPVILNPTENVVLGSYTVGRDDEMRIDLIFRNIYDLSAVEVGLYLGNVDVLLSLNNIDNPLNIKEGTIIRYPELGQYDSFRLNINEDSAKIKDSIGKQLAVPNKTTRKDKSRGEYLSSDYSLPPVVLDAPKEPVRIEDDNFSIGGL